MFEEHQMLTLIILKMMILSFWFQQQQQNKKMISCTDAIVWYWCPENKDANISWYLIQSSVSGKELLHSLITRVTNSVRSCGKQ